MGRKQSRVRYHLDVGEVKNLTDEELRIILRGADELITTGGRTMLAKILKGSRDKKILELGLDKSPSYGFYRDLTITEITNRIDWTIQQGYLRLEYYGRLPMLVYSDKGWMIERETYAEELVTKLTELLDGKDYSFVYELKDRDREMILMVIDKIKQTRNARFIPLLKVWKENEYKKVQAALQKAINFLVQEGKIF